MRNKIYYAIKSEISEVEWMSYYIINIIHDLTNNLTGI